MVDLKIEWTNENVSEFVKYTMMTKGKTQKILTVVYAICFSVVLIASLIAFFVTGSWLFIMTAAASALLLGSFVLFMKITMKKLSISLYDANKDSDVNVIQLSSEDIIVCREGQPVGRIPWDSIAEIDVNKNAVYLTSKENALLLLEKERITGGTAEELDAIIKEKNAELSKKA